MNIYLEKGAYVPERAHKTDAGLDIRSCETRLVKTHSMRAIKSHSWLLFQCFMVVFTSLIHWMKMPSVVIKVSEAAENDKERVLHYA